MIQKRWVLVVLLLLLLPSTMALTCQKVYTNNQQPTISITFDRNVTQIDDLSVFNISTEFDVLAQSTPDPREWDFSLQETLGHGDYGISFYAIDRLGNGWDDLQTCDFAIDLVDPRIYELVPLEGSILTQTNQRLIIRFFDDYPLPYIQAAQLVAPANTIVLDPAEFTSLGAGSYELFVDVPDGNYDFEVLVSDQAGNIATNSTSFIMNAVPLNVSIVSPSYGVAGTNNFRFEITSTKPADCRFTQNPTHNYSSMSATSFTTTGGNSHVRTNMTLQFIQTPQDFYVMCVDNQGILSDRFHLQLLVDNTAPTIQSIDVYPNNLEFPRIINEGLDLATLEVRTDDTTRCRYSTTPQNHSTMTAFEEQDFAAVNRHNLFSEIIDGSSYSYYAICENRAGLLSSRSTINFTVNLSAQADIRVHSPQAIMGTGRFIFNITTAESTSCTYGDTESPTTPLTSNDGRHHTSPLVVLTESDDYVYYVRCLFSDGPLLKAIPFVLDIAPPSKPNITADQYSCSLSKLKATFSAIDNRGPVTLFNYTLSNSSGVIREWQTSSANIDVNLDLVDGQTYTWRVKAIDAVGHNGAENAKTVTASRPDIAACDDEPPVVAVDRDVIDNGVNITLFCVDAKTGCTDTFTYGLIPSQTAPCTPTAVRNYNDSLIVQQSSRFCWIAKDNANNNASGSEYITVVSNMSHCVNSVQDDDETDVDCGGATCLSCDIGDQCVINGDCRSEYCLDDVCAEALCTDNVTNGDESDIDCGGSCLACGLNKTCAAHSDCSSGFCDNNVCTESSCSDNVMNGDETDVDCGGSCDGCGIDDHCLVDGDCNSGNCYLGYCALEVDQDPDPVIEEKNRVFQLILLIVGILLILGGVGYLMYVRYFNPPPLQPRKPLTVRPAVKPKRAPLPLMKKRFVRKQQKRSKQRSSIFSKFTESKPAKTKDNKPLVKKNLTKDFIPLQQVKKVPPKQPDVFAQLETIGKTELPSSPTAIESQLKKQLKNNELTKEKASELLFDAMEKGTLSSPQVNVLMQRLGLL